MRFSHVKAGLGIVAVAAMLAIGGTANAAPVSKCSAAKKKCIGKYIAAVMGCHAKAEGKNVGVDPACLAKATAKITGGGKGCFDKNDAKIGNDCQQTNDAGSQLSAADAFILDVVNDIDPGYPTPVLSKCGAARKKCVGKKAAGLMGCDAKANKDGVGDPACAPKITDKFGGAKGCDVNALLKGTDCLGTATTGSLETKTDTWQTTASSAIDSPANTCGNNANDPGEPCDPTAPSSGWAQCGPDFTCTASCNCACPTSVVFAGDATSANSVLDTGWTGISHRAPIISDGQVSVGLSCTATSRPCGTCNVSGLLPNPHADAGQLNDRRCSQDSSRKCTVNADCTTQKCLGGTNNGATCANDTACPGGTCPAAGFCNFYFGAPLALAAGGVSTCISNQFNGNVSGTANVETGDATTTAFLTSKVFNGIAIDNPCPRCSDTVINDGTAGGTCDGGPRQGLTCDSNGQVPSRPDFGKTSLDCPANPAGIIATLAINLSNSTGTTTKTLTASSPNCTGSTGDKCLCNTCNDAAAEPCMSNADCTTPGHTICGGKRCLGGANVGNACTAPADCPSSSCAVPGEPTKPSGCQDDTTTVNTVLECADGGDGDGVCSIGPQDQNCTLASGHAQRGCTQDADCGGVLNSCGNQARRCFQTGGGNFATGFHNTGTNTLIAVGMADVPMADTANPTLGAVFCVGPTGSSSINAVAGLPGPSRITIKGTAVAHP